MTVIVVSKEERKEHARTRAEVSQLQDKLELALAEVDILRKQIQREKAQFEQTKCWDHRVVFKTVDLIFDFFQTYQVERVAGVDRFAHLKPLKLTKRSTLPAAGSSDATNESEAVSARQLHNKNVRLSSARQPQPANINCTEARQPRPGVKCSQVTDGLSDREIEIQQQRYISCLINSKSSSSRLQRRHAPPHSIDVKQSLASASDDVTSWRLTH